MSTPTKSQMRTCPHCGHLIPSSQSVCIYCGKTESGETQPIAVKSEPAERYLNSKELHPPYAIAAMVTYTAVCMAISLYFPTAAFIIWVFTLAIWIVCSTYYRPKIQPKNYDIAEPELDEDGLAVLNGTEKQNEWVVDIREQRLDEADYIGYKLRNDLDDDGDDFVIKWLKHNPDVRMWIDTREMDDEDFYQFVINEIETEVDKMQAYRSTVGPMSTKDLLSHPDQNDVYSRVCTTKDCKPELERWQLVCPKCNKALFPQTVADELHTRQWVYPMAAYTLLVAFTFFIGISFASK